MISRRYLLTFCLLTSGHWTLWRWFISKIYFRVFSSHVRNNYKTELLVLPTRPPTVQKTRPPLDYPLRQAIDHHPEINNFDETNPKIRIVIMVVTRSHHRRCNIVWSETIVVCLLSSTSCTNNSNNSVLGTVICNTVIGCRSFNTVYLYETYIINMHAVNDHEKYF